MAAKQSTNSGFAVALLKDDSSFAFHTHRGRRSRVRRRCASPYCCSLTDDVSSATLTARSLRIKQREI